jgi:3-keto-disaccharide hydrolase
MILRHAPLVTALAALAGSTLTVSAEPPKEWGIHDLNRPQPKVIQPGTASTAAQPPPSDAIVLFDGKDLSRWRADKGGGPAGWKVENGYMEVVKGAGGIHTDQGFGDVQLHVEWRTATPGHGEGQERSNSGVFLMGMYEVQVLDSHGNKTYPDGQASALYGQYPPLVNASRPAGEWQTYDIVFRAPRFAADGSLVRPARATVFHNGVLTQDNQELTGPTAHKARPPYKAHEGKLPIGLQDHGDPVRFRNVWVRELS